ncbi:MAG: hypothetical protein U0359_38270 [Byssovorax sp.]
MIYNDFDLQLGDDDGTRTWGGQKRPVAKGQAASGATTTLGSTSPVADLQRDLAALGFSLVAGADAGKFDDRTEWAVRELQCYGKMDTVAKEDTTAKGAYVERLSEAANATSRYTGPVSGVVNAATRALIEAWSKDKLRCPVVLDAYEVKKGKATRKMENVWLYDEVTHGGWVVKARDFSGYYQKQAADDPLWDVAKSLKYKKDYGPAGDLELAWPSVEVTPELVFNDAFASLDGARQSTFRVARCVAEIECKGFFDIINAYDRAVVSTGLVHWTFLDGSGELSQMLAKFAELALADYNKAFVFFGLDVRAKVGAPAVRLQAEDGTFKRVVEHPDPKTADEKDLKREEIARLDYVRNWHWCYRFVMAARMFSSYRQEMWKMMMERIVRIMDIEWDTLADVTVGTGPDATTRTATVGDAITSEVGMGILLRWHVLAPAQIQGGKNKAGKALKTALTEAKKAKPKLKWSDDPKTWGQGEEDALVQALKDEADNGSDEMKASIPKVSAFPGKGDKHWKLDRAAIGALSTTRGSFDFTTFAGYGYYFADDPLTNDETWKAQMVRPGPIRSMLIRPKPAS